MPGRPPPRRRCGVAGPRRGRGSCSTRPWRGRARPCGTSSRAPCTTRTTSPALSRVTSPRARCRRGLGGAERGAALRGEVAAAVSAAVAVLVTPAVAVRAGAAPRLAAPGLGTRLARARHLETHSCTDKLSMVMM